MKTTEQKPKLSRRIVIYLLSVTSLSIGLVGFFWIRGEYAEFREASAEIRKKSIQAYQDLLKTEVGTAISFIAYQKGRVEPQLKQSIQGRVNEAHAICLNIFNQYRETLPRAEIQEMVKQTLRSIRFNNGRGYFFAFNLEGRNVLNADMPELEGKDMLPVRDAEGHFVVRDMRDIVLRQQEGFYQYAWTKPNRTGEFPKIAYVKWFAPFGWVLGTGEYLDDVEADIRKEVIDFIETIRFGSDGYVFVTQWDGVSLTPPAKGRNMWETTDSNGTKIVQEMVRLAKSGSGFLEYVMPELGGTKTAPKLSYVVGIPEWHWYVGTGIYIDEIEKVISLRKSAMKEDIFSHLTKTLWVLAGIFGLVGLSAYWVLKKTGRNLDLFTAFFENAATSLDEIDVQAMNYAELQHLAESANTMVTARKRAEQKVIEGHAALQTILEKSPFGVAVIGMDRRILWANPYLCMLAGFDNPAPLFGKECGLYFCPQNQDACPILDMGQKIDNTERILRCKDGHEIPILKSVIEIEMNGETVLLETFVDISEQKRAENERKALQIRLSQAQKMEAIGSLAGGIAHDLNNILFPISGLSEILLSDLSADHPFHDPLEQIHKSATRGSDLVKQILAFSRQSNPDKLPIRLQPILTEVLKLARSTIPQHIAITSHLEADCGRVSADPTQVHQIVMNLITNAYHAVEAGGGSIHVELKKAFPPPGDNSAPTKSPGTLPASAAGSYACITVSDTGCGIDPDVMDKIFEPYFTTKGIGKGTGLGLSVVHGIVKEYGGDIRVSSEIGKGTAFRIYLPLLQDAKDRTDTVTSGKYPTGNERILLVDDEEPVALMEQMMLERLGYRTTVRTGSPDALAVFGANPADFDLVISDRGMPNMTGEQLARELMRIRPGIPIILCTGFADETDERYARSLGIRGFLMKPLTIGDLSVMVRNVLDSGGRGRTV